MEQIIGATTMTAYHRLEQTMAEQNLQRRLAEQNTLNLTKPKPRRQAPPQPDENRYDYQVAIPGEVVAKVQRYLDENKGVSYDDVFTLALEAWFAATPPTIGG
jgi:hypothetical protein